MKQLTLREIQQTEFKLLCEALRLFKEYKIHYILCGGTLLGAIRHNGFIPWDDDIDIFVPRKDYERLKKLIKSGEFAIEGADCYIPGQPDAIYPFIKIYDKNTIIDDHYTSQHFLLHLWVDVFPLDHYPDGKLAHKICLCWNLFFRAAHSMEITRKGIDRSPWIRRFFKAIYRICGGYNNINKIIDFSAKCMNAMFLHSNHYGNGAWPNGMKDYYTLDMMKPVTHHLFEGKQMVIPANYDKNLTNFYGDYMKLPPEEERYGHLIEAWR